MALNAGMLGERGRGAASAGSAGEGYGFALALLVGLWAVMIWPWLTGRVTIPWDAKAHFQPQIQFLAQSLARGEMPFWAPYVFAGHPQIADPQSMIFSPPFLLLALANGNPSSWAVDMTVLGSALAGGMALMLWFRDRGWHAGGALIAALAFAFGASMAWRIQHTGQVLSLATFPFALLCLDRAIGRRSYLWAALAGIAGAHLVIGRDQVALLCLYVLAGFVIWRLITADDPRGTIRGAMPPLIAGGIVAVALAALPIALTAALAAESNRPAIDYIGAGRGSLHPALLVTLVAPHAFGAAGDMADYWGPPSFPWEGTGLYIAQNMGQVYIGAIPLLLIGLAALAGRLTAREIAFFTAALVLILLYALGWYTPAFRAMYEVLPGVKLYRRPADATFLIGGLGAILAGYAGHRLLSEPWEAPRFRDWLVLAALLAATVGLIVGFGVMIGRTGRLPMPLAWAIGAFVTAAALLIWAIPRMMLEPRIVILVLGLATAADLGWNNGPSTSSAMPTAMYEAMEPGTRNETIVALKRLVAEHRSETRRDRVELVGLGFHWPNLSLTHRLEHTLGYNPVRLGLYSKATGAEDTVGLPDQRKFSALMPGYRSLLADMLGLRYIASSVPIETVDKRLAPGELVVVAKTKEATIYENPRALPRVLFAGRAEKADLDAILATGRWPEFDPRTTVLIADAPSSPAVVGRGTARIVTYRNNEVVIEADSERGGWVVLNDVWHPWWQAEIDGEPASLHRANVLFRAVAVPGGRHVVRFAFQPIRGLFGTLMGRRPFAAEPL